MLKYQIIDENLKKIVGKDISSIITQYLLPKYNKLKINPSHFNMCILQIKHMKENPFSVFSRIPRNIGKSFLFKKKRKLI